VDERDREEQLIGRARRGDLRAFAALVNLNEERMFLTAYRILHSKEDAEDCVQETFLRAWDRLSTLEDSRAFRTWLYRILTHLALDTLRARIRLEERQVPLDEEVVRLPVMGRSSSPREALRQAREADRIESAIETLAPKQKVVFVLRHFQGLKISEIAAALDSPTGTVKATLHAALRKLQKNLVERKKIDREGNKIG
jgi:RNA polymerase sigma-70 factor (ECF subfamily)